MPQRCELFLRRIEFACRIRIKAYAEETTTLPVASKCFRHFAWPRRGFRSCYDCKNNGVARASMKSETDRSGSGHKSRTRGIITAQRGVRPLHKQPLSGTPGL